MSQQEDWKTEQKHLSACRNVIAENVTLYEKQCKERHEETQRLFREVQSGNEELYDALMTSKSLEQNSQNMLANNKASMEKPFFGKITYQNLAEKMGENIYIGKHGIQRDKTDVVVVDWRAPVATVYYENEPGIGTYRIPDGSEYAIDLQNKRTFDIENGKLIGFYDSDVAANDDLLVKYLSKNRDAVLGDIIATIQKEQNEIIRANPFHNIIVQGVAGSGKTTVAMHRISYIMYNYKERFTSNEFCVVGGSDILVDYITGGLPELDVFDVKHMRMDGLFVHLLKNQLKKKHTIQEVPIKQAFKSKMLFAKELEKYLAMMRRKAFAKCEVKDNLLGMLLSSSNNEKILQQNSAMSINGLLKLLDERLRARIKLQSQHREEVDIEKRKRAEYKHYFAARKIQGTVASVYDKFLEYYGQMQMVQTDDVREQISRGTYDVYDMAAMTLIYYRVFQKEPDDEFGQIFIDEAQDFGSSVYYVLHTVLPECYFTIMGDVSQNIHYETGMNDWKDFTTKIFHAPTDEFRLLSKSYRNTIEISKYAAKILTYASNQLYQIDPVIRHGELVHGIRSISEMEAAGICADRMKKVLKKGYETIAVIYFESDEGMNADVDSRQNAKQKQIINWLSINGVTCNDMENQSFQKGISVMPVTMTKGLEFDCVFLWKPDMEGYKESPKLAKQMYVACTRVLHELYIMK